MDPAVEVHGAPGHSVRYALKDKNEAKTKDDKGLTSMGSPMYCLAETRVRQMRRTTKVAL